MSRRSSPPPRSIRLQSPHRKAPYKILVPVEETAVPTLVHIIRARGLPIPPPHVYVPDLVSIGPDRELHVDFLKENLEFMFVPKLDQEWQDPDLELHNQNLNHLKPLMNLWKWWYQLILIFPFQIGASYLLNLQTKDTRRRWTYIARKELYGMTGQLWWRMLMMTRAERKQLVNWSWLRAKSAWLTKFVLKHSYESYTQEIQVHHQMILGNMASIFAQSGKMTRTQAGGSYTFKVSDTCGYGLFVPTLFRRKPGFQNDTSIKYYIIHGTTSKGASRILAEDLLRPGDFSMHHDHLLQSDFPTYGHCSIGQPAEEATLAPLKVRQLTKKILKTSQGSMAAFVCGTYAGRHPPQKFPVAHPDEAQILCGKFGIAKGPHNTLVARSEHTTISAVILTYQHHREVPLPDDRSTSFGSVKSSSNLSWPHSVRRKRPLWWYLNLWHSHLIRGWWNNDYLKKGPYFNLEPLLEFKAMA